MGVTREVVDAHITAAQDRQTSNCNKATKDRVHEYAVGDWVWVFTPPMTESRSESL